MSGDLGDLEKSESEECPFLEVLIDFFKNWYVAKSCGFFALHSVHQDASFELLNY